MSASAAARMEDLYTHVVAPLVLGGELRPVRPIGPAVAQDMASLAAVFAPADAALGARVAEARGSRARLLLPVDAAPPMGKGDWILVAALSDLLQVANPYLRPVLAQKRPRTLLVATESTLSSVAPPRSVLAAVGRHSVFARMLSLTRSDTMVRWWSGSATFRGEPPPARMLAWPSLRRVRVEPTTSTFRDLASHTDIGDESYLRVVSRLLALSPLTDLACAARAEMPFLWTKAALALVSSPLGAATARRAMAAGGPRVELSLERATRALQDEGERRIAESFLLARRAHLAASP